MTDIIVWILEILIYLARGLVRPVWFLLSKTYRTKFLEERDHLSRWQIPDKCITIHNMNKLVNSRQKCRYLHN